MTNFSGLKWKTAATALAAILATSAFGYWSYGQYREQDLRNTVVKLVQDTSVRMRLALSVDGGRAPEVTRDILPTLYDHASAVDGDFQKLRGMDVSPVEALGDAADDYVLTSREILLRWASSHRYRLKLSSSMRALRVHMRADDRSGAWVSGAVRAKERVEEDYRDYRLATDALENLLESFPASRAKLSPHVDVAFLTDDALIEAARRHVLDESRQMADEIDKVRQLGTYR